MIDVSTDASDWIVREPAIPCTKMPHIKEIGTRIPPPQTAAISPAQPHPRISEEVLPTCSRK